MRNAPARQGARRERSNRSTASLMTAASDNILIVDDEESIRRSLAGILSDEGFSTEDAPDGEKALERLRQGLPDLVLLDIAMPGRDGISILEELRQLWPELPVIMMSGHGTIETAVRATQLSTLR